MVPSRLTQQQSSSSSGIFFKGDSHLSSSFANSSNSIPGANRPNPNNNNNSSSVGASSLVTDANSSGGGPRLQRSASINNAAESSSYLCLPTSPMSFSSNNMSVDGSSSVVQQHDPSPAGPAGTGASSATSGLPGPRMMCLPEQQPMSMSMQKKPRVEMRKQEDMMQHQMFQQILQRPDSSMQFQGARSNPQVQALLQQQRFRQQQQQQQILHSMPQLQRAHMQQQQQHHLQQQQQMQMRQQQGMPQPVMAASVKRPIDGGVCTRRLMQYLYHQRQRPQDNAIAYWRKFVAEYYSPRAKKRWCLSLYENVGNHALGVFPQASMDAWQCELCGSKSGKGFEATSEVLPRLNEIKFGSGVIDELLFLDLPREYRFPSGIMMLEYSKAVQESVYEQLRVVREGQLRIIFSHDLKILCWEFCARRHEELLPRRVVAPQVNQLVQVAQKCQSTITESGSDGVSQQDLQTNSNMVISAGRQLAKSMELQSLNDLGFSKRYVRCLQISEVVNSMKDLIDFCREHKAGPIDGLKNYPRHNSAAAKLQMQQKIQEMEQLVNARGIPTDPNTLNKLMGLSPAINNQMPNNSSVPNNNNNHLMANRGVALSGPAQAALSLTNFHMRQNSMNSNPNSSLQQQQLQQPQDSSPSFNNLSQSPSLGGYSTPQPYSRSMSANSSMMQQDHAQGGGSQMQHQQMIQQLLQEISSNSPANSAAAAAGGGGGGGGIQQHSLSGSGPRNGMSFGDGGVPPSRSNSFKAASNSDSSAAAPSSGGGGGGNNGFHQRVGPDLGQNLHLQEELAQDLAQEFSDGGFFSGDLDDGVGFFQNGRRE